MYNFYFVKLLLCVNYIQIWGVFLSSRVLLLVSLGGNFYICELRTAVNF